MSPHTRAVFVAIVLAVSAGCDDSPRHLIGGQVNPSGGDAGSGTGGVITVTDGGVALGDGGMPTSCTLGAAGAVALIPAETMAPGTACGACHLAIGKPILIAGTVYPTYHDADLCLGVTDVQVEVVDNSGASHLLAVDSSGNFIDQSLLELWPSPWMVAVVRGAARRPMVGTVTSGDCNSCHTAPGANAAPGRIVAPDAQ